MMPNLILLRASWLTVKICYYLLPVLNFLFKALLWILGAALIVAVLLVIL